MSAKEARDKALSVNTSESNSQYQEVAKSIASAVNKGNYECWHYGNIKPDVRAKLEMDGYLVGNNQQDRGGLLVKISW